MNTNEVPHTCSYPGCTETEELYDLTPYNAPEQEFSACEKHYKALVSQLLDDGYILDKDVSESVW